MTQRYQKERGIIRCVQEIREENIDRGGRIGGRSSKGNGWRSPYNNQKIVSFVAPCKGNLTNLRRELHLSLAKGNPK
jgi:hypothetical protein